MLLTLPHFSDTPPPPVVPATPSVQCPIFYPPPLSPPHLSEPPLLPWCASLFHDLSMNRSTTSSALPHSRPVPLQGCNPPSYPGHDLPRNRSTTSSTIPFPRSFPVSVQYPTFPSPPYLLDPLYCFLTSSWCLSEPPVFQTPALAPSGFQPPPYPDHELPTNRSTTSSTIPPHFLTSFDSSCRFPLVFLQRHYQPRPNRPF